MSLKVAACAGHGGSGSTAGKRSPDGEYEWNFNDKVIQAFINELNTYKDVEIQRMDDAEGIVDVPLRTRTDNANNWEANIYISFHHNALSGTWGTWTGVETHIHPSASAEAKDLAAVIQPTIHKAYGLRDRGIKATDFHITRETKMPAVLIEGGFIDSSIDIVVLRQDEVLAKVGKSVAEAVATLYKLEKSSTQTFRGTITIEGAPLKPSRITIDVDCE